MRVEPCIESMRMLMRANYAQSIPLTMHVLMTTELRSRPDVVRNVAINTEDSYFGYPVIKNL